MKVIAVNGSPRKGWNTAQMLKSALEGAESAGAEVKYYDLCDMKFTGCKGCCACKLKGNPRFGKCNLRDDLTALLEDIETAGALIVGSPMYVGNVTGMTRNFLERLSFQYISYDKTPGYFKGKVNGAFIFTMNCPEQFADCQKAAYENNTGLLRCLNGSTEYIMANETWQWDNYDLYAGGMFDVEAKAKYHEEVWPRELQKAYDLGKRLAEAK